MTNIQCIPFFLNKRFFIQKLGHYEYYLNSIYITSKNFPLKNSLHHSIVTVSWNDLGNILILSWQKWLWKWHQDKHNLMICRLMIRLVYSTHWGWDRMDAVLRATFQMHFLEWKYLNLDLNFKFVSKGRNWSYARIGSNKGLAPNRHRAIIWTNDDLGYQGIKASLCLNGLNHFLCFFLVNS